MPVVTMYPYRYSKYDPGAGTAPAALVQFGVTLTTSLVFPIGSGMAVLGQSPALAAIAGGLLTISAEPPDEDGRGTGPSQATRSRPPRKLSMSDAKALTAIAVAGSTPDIVSTRSAH